MTIAGVIVGGGQGTRMGGDKPLMPFRGQALIDAVIARVRPQVAQLALNVPEPRLALYRARYDLPLLTDAGPALQGPLGGILAGLAWLPAGTDWLASFPCDTPFLPGDLVARLAAARQGERPVAIRAGDRIHALCALWPRAARDTLQAGLRAGSLGSLHGALAALNAVFVEVPAGDPAFFNVNAPEDLAEAERMAAAGPVTGPRGRSHP